MAQRPDYFTIDSNHQLAQGLVFAGLGALPGSTRYHDSSVFGNHGTLTNMDPTTDWVYGGEISRFSTDHDGTDDYVNLGTKSILKPTGTISACAWVKIGTYSADHGIIGDLGASGARGWWLVLSYISAVRTAFAYVATNATTLYSTSVAITGTTGTWNHLAFTFVPSVGIFLYQNGNLISSNTTTPPSSIYQNNLPCVVGWRGNLAALMQFNGRIADPMIWNGADMRTMWPAIADPSNVMLSGLINYPRRKWWPVVSGGTPATFKAAWAARRRQVIGGGIT